MNVLVRGNLSPLQMLCRARVAGWEWYENVTDKWPGSATRPATGWKKDNSSFQYCKSEEMIDVLRAKFNIVKGTKESLGFDHELDCVECKKPIWLCWCDDAVYIRSKECFDCYFWLCLICGGKSIVIEKNHDGDRWHYQMGTETKPGPYNGFGGAKFTIKFTDGKVVETCDLWDQGAIPKRFWDRLHVNAEFIE